MKKVLGRLSRRFHKDGTPLDEILPQLREIFNQIVSDPPKDTKKCLNMVVNMVTSDPGFVRDVYEWASANNHLTEQICTARVRSLVGSGNIDGALGLIEGMGQIQPHVRTFLPLVSSGVTLNLKQYSRTLGLIRWIYAITPTNELFSGLISKAAAEFPVDQIKPLIDWSAQHCDSLGPQILQCPLFDQVQIITLDDGVCDHCQTSLKILPLSNHQRWKMLRAVFEEGTNPAIIRWVQTRAYDIVIDGANVAHYNNSPFDPRKVVTMVDKINKGFTNRRILLVFSMCRRKSTKTLVKRWPNVDIFYTKMGTNDDLSWLYAALYFPNIWCITNDQMRDHVYYKFTQAVGRNVIDLWMERNIVPFHFDISRRKGRTNVQIELDIPLDYSVRPQYDQNRTHLPLENGQWCCARFRAGE